MSAAGALKIFVDFAMLACFLFLFALPATGVFTHEVLGSFLFVLFLLHNALNYRWCKALFKGGYGAERMLRTSVNAALKKLPRSIGLCLRLMFVCFAVYGLKVFLPRKFLRNWLFIIRFPSTERNAD